MKSNDEMFLREEGDYRSDVNVKREVSPENPEHFQPVLAVDDRSELIEVWQSFAIPTVQVTPDGALADRVVPTNLAPAELVANAMRRMSE